MISNYIGRLPRDIEATVALGGGGARGLAHIGAIRSIVRSNVQVSRYVGVSIGSLVGAMVASSGSIDQVQEVAVNYLRSPLFLRKQNALFAINSPTASSDKTASNNSGVLGWYDRIRDYLWSHSLVMRMFHRRSLLPAGVLDEIVEALVPDIDIAECKIPLSIIALDLLSGRTVVLNSGPLRKAVLASAAIPGVFPAVCWNHMQLCDIGVIDALPAEVARQNNDHFLIGVDVGPNLQPIHDCPTAIHTLLRVDEIAERILRKKAWEFCDLAIRPQVGALRWHDFTSPEKLIAEGERAADEAFCHLYTPGSTECKRCTKLLSM